MGVLQIIATKHLGETILQTKTGLKRSLDKLDAQANRDASHGERERIAAIVELCFEYDRETDPSERANILRTLEEIAANAEIELPSQTIEEFESELVRTDSAYKAASEKEVSKTQRFLKKYSSLKAKAGLATQAEVAKKSGLSRSYVAVIEAGEHRPQQKTLQKLAQAFGVDVTELL
jgi:DNA-binding XRE family transcriptional regulator